MGAKIGPTIGIDGEAKYRSEINNLIQQGKTLDAQMKAIGDSFETEAEAQAAAAKQSELLEARLDSQREYVEKLSEMVSRAAEATGENSTETLKWREALANAEGELNRLERSTGDAGSEIADMTTEMGEASRSAVTFGDMLKGNIAAEAIVEGVKALATAIKEIGKAMADVVKESAAYADDILTLSTNTGLGTDTLQEFKYMAELTDTSLQTVTGSLTKLTRNMNSARSGSGAAADAFKALGVSVTDSNGSLRDNEEVFFEVIDALGKLPADTERDALAMDLFGKSAQELNSLIAAGSTGVADFAREAHDMGYVLDRDALESLGAVDDSFQRMSNAATAAKNQLGLALAPTVTDLSEKLLEFSQTVDWDAVGEAIIGAVENVMSVFGWLIDNGDTIISILSGIGTGLLVFKTASTVLELAAAIHEFTMANEGATLAQALLNTVMNANPIVLIISLIAGLVAALITLWNTNDDFRNWVIDTWDGIKEFFSDLISGAVDWGRDLIQNFINGIKEKATALWEGVKDVAQSIADYLHFSVPEKGPLSDFDKSGADMMELYARGIRDNAWKVEDAVGALATDMSAEINAPEAPLNGGSYNYGGFVINVYGAEGQDIEELADDVMTKIQDAIELKGAVFA